MRNLERLACPWCFSSKTLLLDCGYNRGRPDMYYVLCDECKAQGPHKPKQEEAIEYWNLIDRMGAHAEPIDEEEELE